ncbi:LysR family transcriptional regulator [uncultured Castellaniella sp.]|uniref:LysR family transcriptional regulator n=1 Tax=uncultured Castellaniella sp. TaxID=647907 RepID=UPI002624B4E6|nr:LysR family transcriptional regulator [uncultured Castellaniella sp.]
MAMVSFKQLEALYWIAELGTFEKAAARLCTTQSAVSKRIQELESISDIEVFDRSQRGARLTEKGEELLLLAQQILGLGEQILHLKSQRAHPARKLKLGVTELTAWTWLPRLIVALQAHYPKIIIEPEVDMSRALFDRLREGSVDLIIVPETFRDHDIAAVHLASVENIWMARPGMIKKLDRALRLDELVQHPILAQGSRSGSGLHFNRWLKEQGVGISRLISSDSLNAMLGLTAAGLGVSYFPRACFQPLVDAGKLEIIPVTPALPPVPYAAMYRSDRPSAFIEESVEIAKGTCDFSRQLQS